MAKPKRKPEPIVVEMADISDLVKNMRRLARAVERLESARGDTRMIGFCRVEGDGGEEA